MKGASDSVSAAELEQVEGDDADDEDQNGKDGGHDWAPNSVGPGLVRFRPEGKRLTDCLRLGDLQRKDMLWRRRLEPLIRPVFQAHARLKRGMTLGVRGLAVNAGGEVLLIEHTYVHGWHLPGGGVERGETTGEALAREMREEAGVVLTGAPQLMSIHDSGAHFPGDHVLLYLCRDFEMTAPTSQGEIHAVGWFAPDALPEGVTSGTRARIAEALHGKASDPYW